MEQSPAGSPSPKTPLNILTVHKEIGAEAPQRLERRAPEEDTATAEGVHWTRAAHPTRGDWLTVALMQG